MLHVFLILHIGIAKRVVASSKRFEDKSVLLDYRMGPRLGQCDREFLSDCFFTRCLWFLFTFFG